MGVLRKKIGSPKSNGKFVIFAQKIAIGENLDIGLKVREASHIFETIRKVLSENL